MVGKAALAIEAGFAWPPPHGHWMRSHFVMANVDLFCQRIVLLKRVRRALLRLESWLPPGPHHANPPLNTEYPFDAGTAWSIPSEHFGASHARTAFHAVTQALSQTKQAYQAELSGLTARVPNA